MSASRSVLARHRRVLQYVLGGVFVLTLLGVAQASEDGWQAVAASVGFATAIAMIAAVSVAWEDVVAGAETAGLVKQSN